MLGAFTINVKCYSADYWLDLADFGIFWRECGRVRAAFGTILADVKIGRHPSNSVHHGPKSTQIRPESNSAEFRPKPTRIWPIQGRIWSMFSRHQPFVFLCIAHRRVRSRAAGWNKASGPIYRSVMRCSPAARVCTPCTVALTRATARAAQIDWSGPIASCRPLGTSNQKRGGSGQSPISLHVRRFAPRPGWRCVVAVLLALGGPSCPETVAMRLVLVPPKRSEDLDMLAGLRIWLLVVLRFPRNSLCSTGLWLLSTDCGKASTNLDWPDLGKPASNIAHAQMWHVCGCRWA